MKGLFTSTLISRILKAPLYQNGSEATVFSVQVDSRKAASGCLFVALPGARVDGHDYISAALEAGACGALLAETWTLSFPEKWNKLKQSMGHFFIIVKDTLAALQKLAAEFLAGKKGLLRIGISGSNGKTTVKELLGSILKEFTSVFISPGNLNSDIGLPLASFQVDDDHKIAVFEMAMDHQGEMDELCAIVKPQLGIISNIGTAHIAKLGSRDAIAAEKGKLLKALPADGAAFIYSKDDYADFLKQGCKAPVLYFDQDKIQGLSRLRPAGLDGYYFHFHGQEIHLKLNGEYNLRNALAALRAASHLNVPAELIKKGLERYQPLKGRGNIIKGKITLIEDCYNASPESMLEVIRFVSTLDFPGVKHLVLGPMLELGGQSRDAHLQIVELVAKIDCQVFLYGREMEEAFKKLKDRCSHLQWTDNMDDLACRINKKMQEGDLVLLKASRAAALERLIAKLRI